MLSSSSLESAESPEEAQWATEPPRVAVEILSVRVSELNLNSMYMGERQISILVQTSIIHHPLPLSQGITTDKKATCRYHVYLYHILKRHILL